MCAKTVKTGEMHMWNKSKTWDALLFFILGEHFLEAINVLQGNSNQIIYEWPNLYGIWLTLVYQRDVIRALTVGTAAFCIDTFINCTILFWVF